MKTMEEAAESEAAKTGRMLRASLTRHQIAPMGCGAASGLMLRKVRIDRAA
jgi:hypothetical protein